MQLNKKQAQAKQQILDWAAKHPRVISLQGAAGTGKTTLLGEVLPDLRKRFPAVIFTGMTGKAALRLAEVAKVPCSTLHRVLYQPPGADTQELVFEQLQEAPSGALLVVDEASMVTPDIWEDLLKWVDQGVAVMLVGDGYQLPPILSPAQSKVHGEAYSVFAHTKGPVLDEVMRSGDDVLNVATRLRVEQKITRETRGRYSYLVGKSIKSIAERHAADVKAGFDSALITWRNSVRMNLNAAVRHTLGHGTDNMPHVGEPIMFCKNGYGALNGEIAILSECVEGHELGPVRTHSIMVRGKRGSIVATLGGKEAPMDGQMAFLRDDDWRCFVRDKRAYKVKSDPVPITWGYALTAHKAQGSEYENVIVFLEAADGSSKPFLAPSRLPDGTSVPFWCRWLYTSISRSRKNCSLVMGA